MQHLAQSPVIAFELDSIPVDVRCGGTCIGGSRPR